IVLREARNVKYGTFMEPGKTMMVTAELLDKADGDDPQAATFKGKGECEGASTVSARVTLTRYNLRDRNPALKSAHDRLIAHLRGQYALLRGELEGRASCA